MYIDTHSHLDAQEFSADREATIQRAKEAGVEKIYIPNINLEGLQSLTNLCHKHQGYLYPMIGLHPEEVNENYQQQLDQMHTLLATNPQQYVAIGEIGLDFYWDNTYKTQQIDAFEQQIEWAIEFQKPIMIHSRNSQDTLINIMEHYRSAHLRGVFHCFSGNANEARQLLSYPNFYLGIGGIVTFKKSELPQVLKESVPLSRIVLETDSPYLAPVPNRGKRNESAFIDATAKQLSAIYGLKTENIASETKKNAIFVFRY